MPAQALELYLALVRQGILWAKVPRVWPAKEDHGPWVGTFPWHSAVLVVVSAVVSGALRAPAPALTAILAHFMG